MMDEKIAIIGTGRIGISLAALFTGNGYETTVLATKEESAQRGQQEYEKLFAVLRQRGLMTEMQATACQNRLHFVFTYEAIAQCSVFFECTVEDAAVKRAVYQRIEANCPQCKVIASASSAMSPEDLCQGLTVLRGRLLVTHPFHPPHLVPFVELVKSAATEESAAQLAYDLLEDCGRKVCVMKKGAPGFIANRLQHALLREALYMVEQGLAEPRDIDKALMYSFMPRYTAVGLFEHQDAAGLDMVQQIENYLFPDLCDKKEAFDSINCRVAQGTRGQKDGKGIYQWDADSIQSFQSRAAEPYWQYFNWRF